MSVYKPLISVIIPCYNAGKYLPDAIESVMKQTYENVECIVVDDGSTDNTEDVVRDYCKQDDRIKYHKKSNAGVSTARNYGIRKANGEFIQFLDADDWLNIDKFKTQIDYIIQNNLNEKNIILYTDYELIWLHENNDIINRKELTFRNLSNGELKDTIVGRKFGLNTPTPLSVCSALIKKSVLNDYKYNEDMYNYGDMDFFYRVLYGNTKFYYTPIIGFSYRQQINGISKNTIASRRGYLQFLESIYRNHPEDLHICPNMSVLLEHFVIQRDKEKFRRAMTLVRNTSIPIFSRRMKNIRNKIVMLDKLRMAFLYLSMTLFIQKFIMKLRRL